MSRVMKWLNIKGLSSVWSVSSRRLCSWYQWYYKMVHIYFEWMTVYRSSHRLRILNIDIAHNTTTTITTQITSSVWSGTATDIAILVVPKNKFFTIFKKFWSVRLRISCKIFRAWNKIKTKGLDIVRKRRVNTLQTNNCFDNNLKTLVYDT